MRYTNRYHCARCNVTWEDDWSCICNDKCPTCDAEIEPEDSVDHWEGFEPPTTFCCYVFVRNPERPEGPQVFDTYTAWLESGIKDAGRLYCYEISDAEPTECVDEVTE